MPFTANWISHSGTRTEDNRDFCGIGQRSDSILCIVLDGSTTGQGSGEFASSVAKALVDWFVAVDHVTGDAIVEQLRFIHAAQIAKFRHASASFAIAWVDDAGHAQLFHAGDCLVGSQKGETLIQWETRPHTLADVFGNLSIAEIATLPARNRVTRSLRQKGFMAPDIGALSLELQTKMILATDGFWADQEALEQVELLGGGAQPRRKPQDDCSALLVRFSDDLEAGPLGEEEGNFYLVKPED